MNLKTILIFLLSTIFAYSQTKKEISCADLKYKDYYFNDISTFKNGAIKLFSDKNGKRFDALNKLILKNSEYILELNLKNNSITFHKPDSLFDNSEENKTFQNWVDHLDLSKIFTLNSESKLHQKLSEEKQLNNESGELSTTVFCSDKILVYHIQLNDGRDKGSLYDEFLNIDLNKIELVDFNSLITVNQQDAFNKAVLTYSNNHKKEIVDNYKEILSNGFGDLLYTYGLAFEKPNYDYHKINCKINSSNFSHFSTKGIVFKVDVLDKNKNEENEPIGEYISEITIPYKELTPYFDKKNNLYSSINK